MKQRRGFNFHTFSNTGNINITEERTIIQSDDAAIDADGEEEPFQFSEVTVFCVLTFSVWHCMCRVLFC